MEADKLNFLALLAEFRSQLDAVGPNYLLSVAMGTGRNTYQHLDMASVARYADQVAMMNYDYAGPWSKRTGLVAPLYHAPGDPEKRRECRFNDLAVQSGWSTTLSNANGPPILCLLVEASCASKPWTLPTRRTGTQTMSSITTLFRFKASSRCIVIQHRWLRGCSMHNVLDL